MIFASGSPYLIPCQLTVRYLNEDANDSYKTHQGVRKTRNSFSGAYSDAQVSTDQYMNCLTGPIKCTVATRWITA